jgi:hypothetical protein
MSEDERNDRGASLQARIDEANRVVRAAEAELEEAVAQLAPVQLGDKRVSSEALDRSFEKLKAARVLVAQLGRILAARGQDEAPGGS